MPAEKIVADSDVRLYADAPCWGLTSVRRWAAAAGDRGTRWATSNLNRLRPRLSLLVGSLLVLVTLICQGTVHYEGTPERGYSMFLNSYADWPGWLGWIFHDAGKGFYTFSLGLAAFTLFLLFAAWRRPNFLRKPRFNQILFLIAGSLALFFASDCFLVLLALGPLLPDTPRGQNAVAILSWTAFVLSWLCPALFWGKKAFLCWTAALAATIIPPFLLSNVPDAFVESWFIYPLIPLALWYRYRVSTSNEVRAQWAPVRNGTAVLYVPIVLWDCAYMARFGFWGLLVYVAGIALISLGYMQLAREGNPLIPNGQVLNIEEQQK